MQAHRLRRSRKAAEWITGGSQAGGKRRGGTHRRGGDPAGSLDETTDPRQKAQAAFVGAEQAKAPASGVLEGSVCVGPVQVSARIEVIQGYHDPTFETTQIKVQIRAASEPEFRQRLATLFEASREGKIERLFRALAVNPRIPPRKDECTETFIAALASTLLTQRDQSKDKYLFYVITKPWYPSPRMPGFFLCDPCAELACPESASLGSICPPVCESPVENRGDKALVAIDKGSIVR